MKKKIATLAIAMIALFGVAANAQDAPQNKMYQPREFTEWAFEGILLDINQQTRIDSLNAAVKAKCPKMDAKECQAPQQCPKSNGICAKDGKQCKKADGVCAKDGQQCKEADGVCAKDGKQCKKADGVCAKDGQQCKKADGVCAKDGKQCKEADGVCAKDGKQCKKADGVCAKDGKQCKKADGKECKKDGALKEEKQCPKQMKHGGKHPMMGCPYGEEYVYAVKEILTPDQYAVFLENIATHQPQQGPAMHQHKMQPQRGKKGDAQMRNKPEKLNGPKKAKAKTK